MNARKKRSKNKRRAKKLADQAWEAANDDNLQLALKMIARAIDLDIGNPLFWNDQGCLQRQAGEEDRAAESFLAVISLAPDFAEAYAHLAEIRLRQDRTHEAVSLQTEAVRLAPQLQQYQKQLAAYNAVAGQRRTSAEPEGESEQSAAATDQSLVESHRQDFAELAARVDRICDEALAASMTRHGYVILAGLLTPQRCQELRDLFDQDAPFAKTVVMDKSRFGQGVYRYFASPLSPLVDAIRRLTYPHAATVANRWQQEFGRLERFPESWEAFRAICTRAGQVTPSPLLLRYEAGGFNALHRDIRGEVFFPLQLVVVLSPRSSDDSDAHGFTGGEFLFADEPQRKSNDVHKIAAGLGDAVLFCTRARPARVAGVYGWQSVQHGAAQVTAGTRYALGIPYHEFT